jgi:hypothetical protein
MRIELIKIFDTKIGIKIINNKKLELSERLEDNEFYLTKGDGAPFLDYSELNLGTEDGEDIYDYDNIEKRDEAFDTFKSLLNENIDSIKGGECNKDDRRFVIEIGGMKIELQKIFDNYLGLSIKNNDDNTFDETWYGSFVIKKSDGITTPCLNSYAIDFGTSDDDLVYQFNDEESRDNSFNSYKKLIRDNANLFQCIKVTNDDSKEFVVEI